MKHSAPILAAMTALTAVQTADASFVTYALRNQWRAAVGPTTYRSAVGSGVQEGQTVSPELWADVGVHLACSGVLVGAAGSTSGPCIKSPVNTTFWVNFDQPITALYWDAATTFAGVRFFSDNTYLGIIADGQLGAVSTIPFNRIQISNGQGAGYIWNLEWGAPVPAPGVGAVLAAGALTRGARRRRR
ncbi:MAG: hypothetical protein U0625_00715 [Phycisphaerales bacterium]